jgi:glycosidase
MKRIIFIAFLLFIFCFTQAINAQNQFNKVAPPHWWSDMKNDTLHLIFYGENLSVTSISSKRDDIKILSFYTSQTRKYCFVDVLIKNTEAGVLDFEYINNGEKSIWKYTLKKRVKNNPYPKGLDQSDLIYLLTPDRFSNGDISNDSFESMQELGVYRDSLKHRHGGDLKGISDHLEYIADLGITSLWLNPVEENDQDYESYHGYAITDHYKIDPRFGTNQDYKNLVDQAHTKGIKMIRDVIFNHFGSNHELIQDLPDSSWINHWDQYTRTTYRATVMLDPHASESDKERFSKGWFDHHMPDMNYKNAELANFMIQNSIWWVEEFNIDAYRIDTYIYPDQDFMKRWAKALKDEYPNLFLFAETWVHGSAIQAWFAGGNRLNQGETYLDGVTDFQLYYAINKAMNESFGWNTGVSQIYYKLVDDVLYAHPENNVLFLDNHDLDRFYGSVDQNLEKFKQGISLLFTLRGIPSLFYGTEILMPYKGDHGLIRTDFPGGWPTDTFNKFDSLDRSSIENEAINFVKYLANWRKNSPAIKEGKLIQFIPNNGLYAYARVSSEEVVLVFFNQSDKEFNLELSDYDDVLIGMRKYHVVMEQMSYSESEKVKILPKSIQILSFKHIENEKNSSFSPRSVD